MVYRQWFPFKRLHYWHQKTSNFVCVDKRSWIWSYWENIQFILHISTMCILLLCRCVCVCVCVCVFDLSVWEQERERATIERVRQIENRESEIEWESQGENIHKWINKWMNIYMYICMYVCMYVCMCVCRISGKSLKNTATRIVRSSCNSLGLVLDCQSTCPPIDYWYVYMAICI